MADQPTNIIDFPREVEESDEQQLSPQAVRWLRDRYIGARSAGEGVDRALDAVQFIVDQQLVPTEMGSFGPGCSVRELAAAEGWERALGAARSAPLLATRAVDLRARLEDVLEQTRIARGVLDQAMAVVDGPPPLGWDGRRDGVWPSALAVSNWRGARHDWEQLTVDAAALGELVARQDREVSRDDYWQAQYERRRAALKAEYSGGGPQYDLLTDALASIDIRVQQMERSERAVPTDEYKHLSELRLKYVAQLQKHTESLKSESVQPVADAIKRLMEGLEREIKPSNPKAWGEIVAASVRVIEQHNLGIAGAA